jgi:hypothetical protein
MLMTMVSEPSAAPGPSGETVVSPPDASQASFFESPSVTGGANETVPAYTDLAAPSQERAELARLALSLRLTLGTAPSLEDFPGTAIAATPWRYKHLVLTLIRNSDPTLPIPRTTRASAYLSWLAFGSFRNTAYRTRR